MKKIIIVAAIALLCASMVFAAGITKKDLAGLKGAWSGEISQVGGQGCVATIEIMNDAEPLEGKITVTNIPMQTQKDYNVQATFTGQSKNGKITSAGTIMFLGSDQSNFFEISSVKAGKMRGWFFMNGLRGTFSGKKK
jgi:uncharacterized protein YdeI (BOF family)